MNKGLLYAVAAGLASMAPAAFVHTQAGTAAHAALPGYTLPETEVWDMQAAHGTTYRIFVSRPDGEAPKGGYPVLYVLDGNAMFAGFAEARRVQGVYPGDSGKMIIVGIGYPGDKVYDDRRMADFTAPIQTPALKELYSRYPAGGRDAFERFLMDRVRPEIARRYEVDERRQSLFGHSLGGLFALHLLFSRPAAFHAIIAASPSIWWDSQAILDDESDFRERIARDPMLARTTRLLILTGAEEEAKVTVTDSMALAKRMEELSRWGLRSEFELFANEGHLTVPSRAVTTTLRYAMQQP